MSSGTRAWRSLVETASAPYARTSRFAMHLARGKLRWDPVFRHLIDSGLIAPRSRVLDIGCGRGLLASLLNAANTEARRGRWPAEWSQAPIDAHVTGIELAPRDVACAREALGASADFVCADIRHAAFPAADAVVLLDVLHYLSIAEQDEVLARVRCALGGGGRLVLRVGDAASRRGFITSQWVDRIVTFVRRQRFPRRAGRTLAQWRAGLVALGFDVSSQPMHRGTPFANVLLVGTVPSTSAAGP
jgi:SAM-dependent methyltransferase